MDHGHRVEIAALQRRDGADPRSFAILSERFNDAGAGRVASVTAKRIRWASSPSGRPEMKKIRNSEQSFKADLVLLAMGFVGPRQGGLVQESGVELDPRGNVAAPVTNYATSQANIFSCGDMRRG